MENASKALLMAGSILIGILVLSLVMYLYVSFSQRARDAQELQENQQITAFNEQYTIYEDKPLTIYDIITVVNKVRQNNREYTEGGDYVAGGDIPQITVRLDGVELQDMSDDELQELLTLDLNSIVNEDDELPIYECDVEFANRRVSEIDFSRN